MRLKFPDSSFLLLFIQLNYCITNSKVSDYFDSLKKHLFSFSFCFFTPKITESAKRRWNVFFSSLSMLSFIQFNFFLGGGWGILQIIIYLIILIFEENIYKNIDCCLIILIAFLITLIKHILSNTNFFFFCLFTPKIKVVLTKKANPSLNRNARFWIESAKRIRNVYSFLIFRLILKYIAKFVRFCCKNKC